MRNELMGTDTTLFNGKMKVSKARSNEHGQIIGDQDGQWDRAAWKTDAFYGNALTGFTPAP